MVSLPRIITVDPTGTIARIVRAAIDLVDRPIILADVPTGSEALQEINRGGCTMLITAWELDTEMRGLELALRVGQASKETAVVILADVDDPNDLDEETLADSPFVFLSRPVDIHQFLNVLMAGLDGQDPHTAMAAPRGGGAIAGSTDLGPVPKIDVNAAQGIVGALLTDLRPMAILLASRSGEVVLESGATGYLDREQLTDALAPVLDSNAQLGHILGGQSNALQYYDGTEHDIFVLTVGIHYLMCVVFDGDNGNRALGAVNNWGRRAANDLVALLGPDAWRIEQPIVRDEDRPSRKQKAKAVEETEEEETPLERAAIAAVEKPVEEEEPALQLDAVPDDMFDPDTLFGQGELDEDSFDDIFDLDALAEEAESQDQGKVDWDQAMQLGILKND